MKKNKKLFLSANEKTAQNPLAVITYPEEKAADEVTGLSEEEKDKVEAKSDKPVKRGFKIVAMTLALAVAFVGGYITNFFAVKGASKTLGWVADYISQYGYYTDEDGNLIEITGDDMAKAIASTLLDKYSAYYTSDEYSDVVNSSNGNSLGIGVSFLTASDDTEVLKVSGNSPADKAGIKSGDIITGAKRGTEEKKNFTDKEGLLSFLKDIKENETVTLFIERKGEALEKTVKKCAYQTAYVRYFDNEREGYFFGEDNKFPEFKSINSIEKSELDGDTAYIKLDLFEGKAASQFGEAIKYMQIRGKSKLILDLRNNGGGALSVLEDIAAYLLMTDEKTPVIVYAKNAKGKITEYKASVNKRSESLTDISVIANKNSASASECLIGALRYYSKVSDDRLIIEDNTGTDDRTYGKGIMQTTFKNLSTGAAIKLTTAKLFLPDKTTSIHGIGFIGKEINRVPSDRAIMRAQEVLR